MAVNNNGTSLLAFNTNRQPDLDRGKDIKHFELSLPIDIKTEIDKWESGDRPELTPRQAAEMLWSTNAASNLDGRIDAWESVLGIKLILPGWKVLEKLPQTKWPENQNDLQKLIAEAGSPGMPVDDFLRRLKKLNGDLSVADFLNDLLLTFKYAAVGRQRPIHLVADLYRLARTLLAEKKGAPSKLQEVFDWLTAPLIVPRVFTAPLGPRGPKPPPIIGDKPTHPSIPDVFDMSSPWGVAIIAKITNDLDEINKIEGDEITVRVLHNAGVDNAKEIANAIKTAGGNKVSTPSENLGRIIRRVKPETMHRTARIISTNIGGFPVRINMAAVNERADHKRREITSKLINSLPENLRGRLNALDVNEYVLEVPRDIDPTLPRHPSPTSLPSYLEPAGRTDLLLVRQTTTGYRRAEISHIENVLIGETRERDHTKRILTRDELFESTEQESEETTDLQTTDSSELSNEINEVVSEDLRLEGSVEVTYRGPTKVVAKAAGAFEKSTENTSNTATEYATEIVERAVKRIFERTKRETKSLFEQEIIEENRHHFVRDNDAEKHVSGIYQYLERISKAKIFSYGERDLYDIMVPEPAALIWNLAIPPTEELSIPIDKPDKDFFESITLDNIESKREDIISSFKVIDFPPALMESDKINVTFSNSQPDNDSDNNIYVFHTTKRIKEGYIVNKAKCSVNAEHEGNDDNPLGAITIGSETQHLNFNDIGSNRFLAELDFDLLQSTSEIGIAINIENHFATTGGIELSMTLTLEKLREWQLEAYSRVAARFEQMQQDYELAKLRAEATQPEEEIDLPAGARRRLKKMVRNELQRAAIGIMRNEPVEFVLINDFVSQGTTYPTTDISALNTHEPEIRFLQQAFEWEHLSWVLYPYFWGQRSNWNNTVVQDHPDPDFAAFLNAGAARLQISVRPGFENLVKHFMETGEAYEGNGLPKMGDPGYVPFIDEQIDSLGGPGEEVPWPPENPSEWDVVTPTPLVLVRKVDEKQLPTWDAQTGDESN